MEFEDSDFHKKMINLINTFEPICIKCGKNLSLQITKKDGFKCPECGYNIVDSAINQIEVHFKDAPRPVIESFKEGVRMLRG